MWKKSSIFWGPWILGLSDFPWPSSWLTRKVAQLFIGYLCKLERQNFTSFMINWCVLFEKQPTNNSAATTIHLFIQTSIAKVLHFLYSLLKTNNIWNPKSHEGLEDESLFLFGMISRWTIWVFQDLFGINSGYLQLGPVLGVCFSEPLGPGYGTSTVPWKIYQSVGFYPQKPLKSTNLHQKLRVWKHQVFVLYKTLGTSIDHWFLWRWEWESTLHSIRIVVRWRGAIIWGHETGETSLAIGRFSSQLLDGHIFSWVHPKHLQWIQLATMKGIDSFWGCFQFQEMKQLLNLDWTKSFSNFRWIFTGNFWENELRLIPWINEAV